MHQTNQPTDYLITHYNWPNLPDPNDFFEDIGGDAAHIGGVKLASCSVSGIDQDWRHYKKACDRRGIPFYVGGGLMDQAIRAQDIFPLVRHLHAQDIDTIEISNPQGFPPKEFLEIARKLREDFNRVLVEVGEKHCNPYAFDWWIRHIMNAQEIGADAIVLEGSTTGKVGIYEDTGQPKTNLVRSIMDLFGDETPIIIEAHKTPHQEYWVRQFGRDVRLGNIGMHQDNYAVLREVREFS